MSLLYYRGHQYQPNELPKGAAPDEVMSLDDYFARERGGAAAPQPQPAPAPAPAPASTKAKRPK